KLVLDLIGERESRKMELVPGFRRDDVWTPAPAPDLIRGSGVTVLLTFYESIIIEADLRRLVLNSNRKGCY
ncbi:MAG: hypothetical protein MUQ20_01755, partial [Deltaproteobacteria bacterium]|nr:hypothetical protein [Deltaproteobacteria bacterium]